MHALYFQESNILGTKAVTKLTETKYVPFIDKNGDCVLDRGSGRDGTKGVPRNSRHR